MTGRELAKFVMEQFGTRDVHRIAHRAGLSIEYGSWYPVTAGELNTSAMKITVNYSANIEEERIIAHELGHYFVRLRRLSVADEERLCDAFAHEFLAGPLPATDA